jgi:hypothetical protein
MTAQRDIRFIPELGFDRDRVTVLHNSPMFDRGKSIGFRKPPMADELIDHVLNILEGSGSLKSCANKPSSKHKRRVTLEAILANMVLSASVGLEAGVCVTQWLYYSRRDGEYSSYPVGSSFSQEELLRLINALESVGLIHNEKADRRISGLGKSSRFIITREMCDIIKAYSVSVFALSFSSPLVMVKDKDKKIMKKLPRDLAKLVALLEKQMRKIRDFVSRQEIDLINYQSEDVTLEFLAKVIERNRSNYNNGSEWNDNTCDEQGLEDYSSSDASAIALRQSVYPYRIFNNGSLEQGGRMFGHWIQRISKEDRKLAVLNDRQTIGLDWTAVHPHIIYALSKKPAPSNMYELDGIDNFNIKIAKKLMLIVFNCKSRSGAVLAMLKRDKKRAKEGKGWGLTREIVNEYIDALIKKHSAITGYFFSGIGLKAQNTESNMAVSVMEKLIDQGIACIPIHDCFIVGVQNREALARAMDEAAEETIGRRIPWKQEY